jgi:hypothetical protein
MKKVGKPPIDPARVIPKADRARLSKLRV